MRGSFRVCWILIVCVFAPSCENPAIPGDEDQANVCPQSSGEWGVMSCSPVVVEISAPDFEVVADGAVIHLGLFVMVGDTARLIASESTTEPGTHLFVNPWTYPPPGSQESVRLRVRASWYDAPRNEAFVAEDSSELEIELIEPGDPLDADTAEIQLARP